MTGDFKNMNHRNWVITINRQLGSGGSYIGQRIARQFGLSYMDREIVIQAAKFLKVNEEDIAHKDEKLDGFWESVLKASATAGLTYTPPGFALINDSKLYETESKIIQRIASERSAVIIGRGGVYALKDHPYRISLFIYADKDFRAKRISELFGLCMNESLKKIEEIDAKRNEYHKRVCKTYWTDLSQYHLSIRSDTPGLDTTEKIVADYINAAGLPCLSSQ